MFLRCLPKSAHALKAIAVVIYIMSFPITVVSAQQNTGLPAHKNIGLPAQKPIVQETGLFGSHETMSRHLEAFKKWTDMLAREKKEHDDAQPKRIVCPRGAERQCYMQSWHDLLRFLKDKPANIQLREINARMNKAPYITDIVNWGVPDYWETLKEFFKKDGDCEDYAIAKYMSLKELGFDPDSMRIVVVQDTNLDVAHAILVVFYKGSRLILDNQIPFVVKEKAVLHYRPFYSINEHAWWLHRM